MINGPVATAGSIPRLWRSIGIKVPITAAFTITVMSAMATVILTKYSALKAKLEVYESIQKDTKINDKK